MSIKNKVKLFLFGSSSSVYGNNKNFNTDNPISFYAATKKCNEIISHSFLQQSLTKIVGLRFFTVYGPWGRPDMAYFIFAKALFEGKQNKVFNSGNMMRDFTYIDDIITSIILIIKKSNKLSKYQLFDIGKGKTDNLKNLIKLIEKNFNKKIKINKVSIQLGDVKKTKANVRNLKKLINFTPKTNLKTGIKKFVMWYKNYHK